VLPNGRNFGRKTQKWPHKNFNGRKNLRPNLLPIFSKKWPKSSQSFLKYVIHTKAFIIDKRKTVIFSFLYTFVAEVFVKQLKV
jgi:hypothetical protein